jgi:hypothetical protein
MARLNPMKEPSVQVVQLSASRLPPGVHGEYQ